MTVKGWVLIASYGLVVLAITKPLGIYLYRVFEGNNRPLARVIAPLESLAYRLCGVNPKEEQTWREYSLALLFFSLAGVLVTYGILRLQDFLPFNPQNLGPVPPDLAFNTAVSFTTNTNWQAYGGESTMSYLSQMAALAWQNFVSAATGMCVALALARGLTRRPSSPHAEGGMALGNFWADMLRAVIYLFLPVCLVAALALASQGVIQTLSPYLEISTLEGGRQTIPLGPVASQEAIKIFGINGGGFFNANSSHPFENPTPLTNFLEMVLIFVIPAALTYTYGRMAGDQRQGWVIFGTMALLFLMGVAVTYWAEARGNTVLAGLPVDQMLGNLEGKEIRFGVAASALFATITTAASCGAVNAMHDSFTPLGGLALLLNIQLGE